MNNELGRKITSLTLMTIMVVGGMTFAFPGAMPVAMAANANLYVSAENSNFSNTMVGPQVVEVVVIDDDINETNEAKGEPDVTVNGNKLRMAQATDGNWYGYFADKIQAQKADQTTVAKSPGYGLDFGQFCLNTSTKLDKNESEVLFSETEAVALPIRSKIGSTAFGVNGTQTITICNTDLDGSTSSGVLTSNATYNGYQTSSTSKAFSVTGKVENVVREPKTLNAAVTATGIGQINIKSDGLWPFIQLYSFTTGGDVKIQYNKGGGVQSTTLIFDSYSDVKESLDRAKYPQGGQVFFTVEDPWLNIDPTDEDSWTFDTVAPTEIYYGLFDENGNSSGDGATSIGGVGDFLSDLMAEEGVLTFNDDTQGATIDPIVLRDNGDVVYSTCTGDADNCATTKVTAGNRPITLVESEPASGIFTTYDESDISQLQIASNAVRGTSGTISYSSAHTILVGNTFATIDIQPTDDEWNSGEEIPIVIVDDDQNKNSRSDEDLTVQAYTNSSLIPALQTGDPFTLGENGTGSSTNMKAAFGKYTVTVSSTAVTGANIAQTGETVSRFSEVALLDPQEAATDANGILFDFDINYNEFFKTVKNTLGTTGSTRFHGTNLVSIDLTGFNATGNYDIYLVNSSSRIITDNDEGAITGTIGSLQIANNVSPKSITAFNSTITGDNNGSYDVPGVLFGSTGCVGNSACDTEYFGVLVIHSSAATGGWTQIADASAAIPVAVDFFSYGFTDDGQQASERVSNQIIRIEVEETGDNTGVFEGSLEYVLVNQLNILKDSTYEALAPIDSSASFLVMEDLTDEDSPRVNYLDLGSDGVSTQIADQQAAPTHNGNVSFNAESYKVADTVTVTVDDRDLNTDSELIDIYTVVKSGSATYDMVGGLNSSGADLPTFGWGALGRLVDITFDDEQWLKSDQGSVTCTGSNAVDSAVDDGLGATNFSLIETDIESGVFVGDFQIPTEYCKRQGFTSTNGVATSTTGVDIAVNYVDFRDASGEIIKVGDTAGVRANTGSVTLDRTVYPVPFGITSDFATTSSSQPSGRSLFPIHQTGVASTTTLATYCSLSWPGTVPHQMFAMFQGTFAIITPIL
jgi:hypothetical protein